MDNRHCLGYTIGRNNKIERMYFLVKIWTKFRNKDGLECSSKNPRTGERQNLPVESVSRMGCRVAGRL